MGRPCTTISTWGNARSTVAFDTIRRYFEYRGYEVTYISNFTDVDDKDYQPCQGRRITPQEVADKYIAAFLWGCDGLGRQTCDLPSTCSGSLWLISSALGRFDWKGFAYWESRGCLLPCGKNLTTMPVANKTLEDLEQGHQVGYRWRKLAKENPCRLCSMESCQTRRDFLEQSWGPWSSGWHIECSVMSTEILGDTIDIHSGGADLGSFLTIPTKLPSQKPKQARPLPTIGCIMALSISTMSRCPSLWATLLPYDALKLLTLTGTSFLFATQHCRKPINFYGKKAVHDAETNLKYLKNTYEQLFTETCRCSRVTGI